MAEPRRPGRSSLMKVASVTFMHEVSLCRAIARIALDHADGSRVIRVHLAIGHLRQVVPDSMRFSWDLVVADTPLAGSSLEITHVPAAITCRTCEATTTLDAPVFRCACGSTAVDVIAGEEFFVTGLDVAEGIVRDGTAPDVIGA